MDELKNADIPLVKLEIEYESVLEWGEIRSKPEQGGKCSYLVELTKSQEELRFLKQGLKKI